MVRSSSERNGHWAARRHAELLGLVMGRRCDRHDLGVAHRDLWIERGELEVLLVLLWAVHPAREREDQGVVALKVAELPRDALLVGQLVVRERAAGRDVTSHGLLLSSRSTVAVR